MSAIQPATIYTEIVRDINSVLQTEHRYLDSTDIRYARILRECDKLIRAMPVEGYEARGMARVLAGDVESAEADFQNALNLAPEDPDAVVFSWCHLLVNLGFHSEALVKFKQSVAPQKAEFSQRHRIGEVIGAVSYLSSILKEAERMRLNFESKVNEQAIHATAQFLQEQGLTDDKLAAALDLAGEVLRAHRVQPNVGHRAGVIELDDEKTYVVEFSVSCDAAEAAEMVYELSERLATLDGDDAYRNLHVTFEADNGSH